MNTPTIATYCPIEGCNNERNQHHLMCVSCWKQVPPAIQRAVWKYYNNGERTALISREYHLARQAAIDAVNDKNKRESRVVIKRLYALSGIQPWWDFVFYHGKDVENREQSVSRRGTIALPASQKMTHAQYEEALAFAVERLGQKFQLPFPPYESIVRGAIVGLVDIVGCVERHSSVWFEGKYGYVLANPRPLKTPIPCKGALGFWEVPSEIVQQIIVEGVL